MIMQQMVNNHNGALAPVPVPGPGGEAVGAEGEMVIADGDEGDGH
jgi:hypothetical protein